MGILSIGVDIGGTNLRVGVVDNNQVIDEQRVAADFSSICKQHAPSIAWQEILRITLSALQPVLNAHPQVKGIGIGFPGFINPHTHRVLQSPNLPGLKDVDLVSDLSQLTGLPVFIENDALVAAYGEYKFLETPPRSMVYIGLGTGVGGGLIHAGLPYPGDHGIAMEVGHMIVELDGRLCGCGNRGCLEQYSAAPGVVATYAEETGEHLSAHQIAVKAELGEVAAIHAYALAGRYLGQVIAHLMKTIDPQLILIGGGLSQAWKYFSPALHAQLDKDLIPILKYKVSIVVSNSGDQAGIIGAAHLVPR